MIREINRKIIYILIEYTGKNLLYDIGIYCILIPLLYIEGLYLINDERKKLNKTTVYRSSQNLWGRL